MPDGYHTILGEKGAKLSGGQKQRISIVRMFLWNLELIILDEATSSLDNVSEKIVQQSIETLTKNRTTIVIAHRLSTICNADKIYVLTDKGIIESGSHEQLVAQASYYRYLYEQEQVV